MWTYHFAALPLKVIDSYRLEVDTEYVQAHSCSDGWFGVVEPCD